MITLDDLAAALPDASHVGAQGPVGAQVVFTRASVDTRDITGGELFFAVTGARDGHDFLAAAVAAGAAGVVISRDVPVPAGVVAVRVADTVDALQRVGAAVRRRSGAAVVAVTGSAGKTTAKTMIAQVLAGAFSVLANKASFNNHLGVPLNLTAIDPVHTHVVAEIGTNHRGEIAHLTALVEPDVAVLTNIGWAHIGNFTDQHELALEKTDILCGTRPGGVWVINGDDEMTAAVLPGLPGAETARIIRYGFGPSNDLRAVDVIVDEHGTHGTLHLTSGTGAGIGAAGEPTARLEFSLAAAGRHFAYAAMLAVAVGSVYGIDPAAALAALAATAPPGGRATVHHVPHRSGAELTVIDDSYNGSPDAMLSSLDLLASLPGATKVAVLGEMRELGRFSALMHQRVGTAAAANATHLVTVGDDAAALRAQAQLDGLPADRIHVASSALHAHRLVEDIVRDAHRTPPTGQRPDVGAGVVVLTKGSRFRHMERVHLGLAGRNVACPRELCTLYINCNDCPHLEVAVP